MSSVNDRLKAIHDRVRPTPRWKQLNAYIRQKYNSMNFATFLATGREASKLIFASQVEVALRTADWSDIDAVTGPLSQIRDEPVVAVSSAAAAEPTDEPENVVGFPGTSPDNRRSDADIEKETIERIATAIENKILMSPRLEKIIDARVKALLSNCKPASEKSGGGEPDWK